MMATGLEEVMVTGAGLSNPVSHPDFSPAGLPIQFGYARAVSFSDQRTGRLDNWSVTIH